MPARFVYARHFRSAFIGVGLLLVLGLLSTPGRAQPQDDPNQELDISLKLKEHTVQGERLTIGYAIPYDGMVELRLKSKEEDKLLFQTQFIRKTGEHEIKLKTNPLEPGQYDYVLTYKGQDTRSSFTVTGEGRKPDKPEQADAEQQEEEDSSGDGFGDWGDYDFDSGEGGEDGEDGEDSDDDDFGGELDDDWGDDW